MSRPQPGRLDRILAQRMRQVADAKGIALSHVADRAGIARSHLWALLAVERSATLGLVQRVADALEVDPLELLTGASPAASRRRRRQSR